MITNTKGLLLSLTFAAILGIEAYPAYQTVADKASRQTASVNQLTRWKSEYETLTPTQAQWDKLLTPASNIQSVYTVRQVVNFEQYALTVDPTTLVVKDVDAVRATDGTPLDADRICLITAGQPGVVATAANIYPTLISGLDRLARRKDIEIQSLTLSVNGNTAKAVFPLCLRLRH